ncbi:MAG: penicillin-binding transpeptidase domain-containing protein, partial [Pseudomonadota bacterium]
RTKQIFSNKTADLIKFFMYLTVENGTGKKAQNNYYMVGGKTGTAEKPINGRYDKNKLISSFVGVLPIDQPEYVILVMLDEPKGNVSSYGLATGGAVAAPVVGKIMQNIAPILGVKKNNRPEYYYSKKKQFTNFDNKIF